MALNQRSQIPSKFEFLGRDQKITQPWQFWLQGLENGLAPIGSGYVIDSTMSTTGPTSIGQGPQSGRTGSPSINSIYFADDTGGIFTVQGGAWQQQTPAYTGDVTKPAFSTITSLANVNATPGVFGSSNTIPILTVDTKGRIINATFAPIEMPPLPGDEGDIVFRNIEGQPATNFNLRFDAITGDLIIGKQITFANAIPTFTNLSPLTTKGDIIGFDGNINVRVPSGTDGYILSSDSSSETGLNWVSPTVPAFIEIPFNYGDASPKFLMTIPQNKMVLMSSIIIKTALDGVGATLSIGSNSSPDDIMPSSDNAPGIISNWTNNPDTIYGSDTDVYLTINNGSGATAGSGLVILQIQS